MSEFAVLHKQDFERNNPLARALRDVGLDLCHKKEIIVYEVIYERVTLDNETWVNINFEIDCDNSAVLEEMNFELIKEISNNQDVINSDTQYIPSFVTGEKKHARKFHGISCFR